VGVDPQGGRYLLDPRYADSYRFTGFALLGPTGQRTSYYMEYGEIRGVAIETGSGSWYCRP
jgi:hypothetical protein